MALYARALPMDQQSQRYDGAPAAQISYQSQKGVPLASSVLTLTDKTTVIEVSAVSGQSGSGGLLMKWGPSSVTASNYDNFIQAGSTRTFVVPQSVFAQTSIAGANVANGLYSTVSFINATAVSTSVYTAEV